MITIEGEIKMFQTEKEALDRVKNSPLRKVLEPSINEEYEIAEDVIPIIEDANNQLETSLVE